MDNRDQFKSGFELMGYNDCFFVGGVYWQDTVGIYLRKACNIAIPSSTFISALAGFLILSNKNNRVSYPLKFIGLICLCQSVNTFSLNSFDHNFCELPSNMIMQNWLVTPGSWTSKVLFRGWHLSNVSEYTIAGWMSLFYNISYNLSLYTEMLLSVCLNFDVLATMWQPFNRVHHLKMILVYMRIGFIMIILLGFVSLIYALQKSEVATYVCTDPFAYTELAFEDASFYILLKSWYNNISLYITFTYAAISFITLVMVILSYFDYNGVTMSKHIRNEIFRKYVIYFLVLNIMELPNVIVVYLRWHAMKKGLHKTELEFEAKFYCWYTFRGTVLPILRLIEPQLASQIRQIFLCKKAKNGGKHVQSDDPNIAFLSSNLNNMLVCGILKGVNMTLNEDPTAKTQKGVQVVEFDKLVTLNPYLFYLVNKK
jgi:hypothetical protein